MPRSTPLGNRYKVLALAREGMQQSTTVGRMGLTRAIVDHILQRYAANGTLCSGLDGADEEFVWNEGSLENRQQLALVPWLPCLLIHKEAPVDC